MKRKTVLQTTNEQQVEQALIEDVRRGNRHAFHQLYDRYVKRVYANCYRILGDSELASDATQEVFIQVWNKIESFNGDSQFSTWLHSLTTNHAISFYRKQSNWLKRFFSKPVEETAEIPAPGVTPDAEIDLDTLIQRLPEQARMVFVLFAVNGYRHEEIANMMGIAVGSSKAQYHRARQLLKSWLD